MVQLLIKRGANVNARDQGISTPLRLASSKWNAETVRLLVENGADVNACDEKELQDAFAFNVISGE